MARRCDLTGKGPQFGHNVSHSNRKTGRRFEPNLQRATLYSELLRRRVPLRVCTRALRSVQRRGGLDAFLLATDDAKLEPEGLTLTRQVLKALAGSSRAAGQAGGVYSINKTHKHRSDRAEASITPVHSNRGPYSLCFPGPS